MRPQKLPGEYESPPSKSNFLLLNNKSSKIRTPFVLSKRVLLVLDTGLAIDGWRFPLGRHGEKNSLITPSICIHSHKGDQSSERTQFAINHLILYPHNRPSYLYLHFHINQIRNNETHATETILWRLSCPATQAPVTSVPIHSRTQLPCQRPHWVSEKRRCRWVGTRR